MSDIQALTKRANRLVKRDRAPRMLICLATLASILFSVGCAGRDVYPDIVDSFEVNKTTQNAVRTALGEPYKEKLDADGNEVWLYEYYKRGSTGPIHFNEKLNDQDWRTNPDYSQNRWVTDSLTLTFYEDVLIKIRKDRSKTN